MGCCGSKENDEINSAALHIDTLRYGTIELDITPSIVHGNTVQMHSLHQAIEAKTKVLGCLQLYFFDGVKTDHVELSQLTETRRLSMIELMRADGLVVEVEEEGSQSKQLSVRKTGRRTVERLMHDLAEAWPNLSFGAFSLSFSGTSLSPSTLLSTLPDRVTLQLKRNAVHTPVRPFQVPFIVLVARIGAAEVKVEIDYSTTCGVLKRKIESVMSLPSFKQRLIHNGIELDDDENLILDSGVSPDSKLHVIAKLSLEAHINRLSPEDLNTPGCFKVVEEASDKLKIFTGVNWIAICPKTCKGLIQVIRGGFGVFSVLRVNESLCCPQCRTKQLSIQAVGFFGCKWRSIRHLKTGSIEEREGFADLNQLNLLVNHYVDVEVRPLETD